MMVAFTYRATHRGLSYSQSFLLTLIFVTIITAMVIAVIGNNLARAFALVGAMSDYQISDRRQRHEGYGIRLLRTCHGSCLARRVTSWRLRAWSSFVPWRSFCTA